MDEVGIGTLRHLSAKGTGAMRWDSGAPRRWSAVACLLALVGACVGCGSVEAWAQAGVDRPGKDYTNFIVRSGDPAVCSARCDRDGRCRAWSFRYPTPAGARGVCYLKNEVPPRAESTCCISGVRGAGVIEPRDKQSEFGIDRPGGDYRNFEVLPLGGEDACASACTGDNRCRAWTYVRPGYIGPAARCYLKSRITPPRSKPCCISGVVR